MTSEIHVTTPISANMTRACTDTGELSVNDLELVSGGDLATAVHRLGFALGCILGGNTLTIKGDQLQCKL